MSLINKKKYILILILGITILSSIFLFVNKKNDIEEMSYSLFLQHIDKGLVEEVELGNSPKIKVTLHNGNKFLTDNPRTAEFKEVLLLNDVKVVEKDQLAKDTMFLVSLVLMLGVALFYFRGNISKQAEKEMASMSKMDGIDYEIKIRFDDVAGNEEAKESLKEMVDFIKNPEIYNEFGARLPRGVLLYGPPGTGKTLLAKALAGEAGVPIFPVSGSDFVQVYAGLGASRIRDLFKKAKEAGKSVIFIDEIDSLGKKKRQQSFRQ